MKKGLCIGLLFVLIVGGYFVGIRLFHKEQVAEKQEQKRDDYLPEEKKVPKMVKINGTLYYNTGKLSTIEGRCGMADGYIYSTVLPNETPKEDNESNFGGGYEYQYWDENTIELRLPTGWIVFTTNEAEADIDVEKNYVTIQDGKIDDSKLVDQFIEKVNQNYGGEIAFYNEDSGLFYKLVRARYDIVGEPYTQVEHGYEYQLYIDTMKEEKPRYYFYQFQSLDMSNGITLRDSVSATIDFDDNVIQLEPEEFVIY